MKIPIGITKIKTENSPRGYFWNSKVDRRSDNITEFLISVSEKGQKWDKTITCSISDLEDFKNKIEEHLKSTTTAERLNISDDEGEKLDELYANDTLCKDCNYKQSYNCITCIFDLQSPLERKLFLELRKNNIRFQTQYGIDWNGNNINTKDKSYHNPTNNFKEVLTISDFFIEVRGSEMLCIYTDGHTYHERTEKQAQKDKKIDRKLQELGYTVLRYTGKDINENMPRVIDEIKKWTKKK